MQFFLSPDDLGKWVRHQQSPDDAAKKILTIIGPREEQDVVDTCRSIFVKDKDNYASDVLFNILAKHNLTQVKEGNMKDNKMKKVAQVMRSDSLYGNMPLRICPKLPFSQGKRLISTYNCRHYCLDSIVFDDDPMRVYCSEALWRRHIMDKFSSDWKNKDGKLVGGYINERFQVSHDDGGNNMELANGERTRKPRPHQYSTERRLEEARGEKTYDLTASSNKVIKLASKSENLDSMDNEIYQIFDDMIEMKQAGLSDEDIITKTSEHYKKSIFDIASIYKIAISQLGKNNGTVYSCSYDKLEKTSQRLPERSTMVTKKDIEIITLSDGQKKTLKIETPVVVVANGENPVFEIVDGYDAGKRFSLVNKRDIIDAFEILEEISGGLIQDAADELGLNEKAVSPIEAQENFPITEIK
jgi:hypothetical protein